MHIFMNSASQTAVNLEPRAQAVLDGQIIKVVLYL